MDTLKPSVRLEEIYSATSCNRIENGLSCRRNYLLYSRSRCPILYDLNAQKVAARLLGHQEDVNGLAFVENLNTDQPLDYLLSTSYDKTCKIWEVQTNLNGAIDYKELFSFSSPSGEVFMTRCSIKITDGKFITVTTTVSGNLYLWSCDSLLQEIQTKCCYFHAKIKTVKTDNEEITILFLAGGDNNTHIFQLVDHKELKFLLSLAGHEDWVKCVQTLDLPNRRSEFLLATASQDSYIRVWHFRIMNVAPDTSQTRKPRSHPLISSGASENLILTSSLETVLTGHEGIVHGLCWFGKHQVPTLKLITCSADKTIIIWSSSLSMVDSSNCSQSSEDIQSPATAEIWKENSRVGETGENNLPFLSICLSEDEKQFYSNSLRGAIHSWKEESDGSWSPGHVITGHSEPVTDLAWEHSGEYLLSSSLDKTCRLHGISRLDDRWHELARPQAHGHEINCLASLDFTRFASGSEEKTVRAFESTQFFLKNYKSLAKLDTKRSQSIDQMLASLPVHAQLPALGLSNRGAQCPYDVEESGRDNTNSSGNAWYGVSKLVEQLSKLDHLDNLPFEEMLLQSTLWWETNKLYGHSNELHALDSSTNGQYLASASRANRPDLAIIFVWECSKFRKVASIEHHSLTVTRLRFSPDDKYLLSVSRDRTWCLSKQTDQIRSKYKKLAGTVKSNSVHERIIWDCCWTCDSNYFITVSRDKKVVQWSLDDIESQSSDPQLDEPVLAIKQYKVTTFLLKLPIQAVDSLDYKLGGSSYLFAFGLEDGSLELHCSSLNKLTADDDICRWQHLKTIDNFHQISIRRLSFRPRADEDEILLASAGDDCIVKLTKIQIH